MKQKPYADYLASVEWRTVRYRILERDYHTCACGKKATQVHHICYARVGNEQHRDLRAVCGPCHHKIHLSAEPLREATIAVLGQDAMPRGTGKVRAPKAKNARPKRSDLEIQLMRAPATEAERRYAEEEAKLRKARARERTNQTREAKASFKAFRPNPGAGLPVKTVAADGTIARSTDVRPEPLTKAQLKRRRKQAKKAA